MQRPGRDALGVGRGVAPRLAGGKRRERNEKSGFIPNESAKLVLLLLRPETARGGSGSSSACTELANGLAWPAAKVGVDRAHRTTHNREPRGNFFAAPGSPTFTGWIERIRTPFRFGARSTTGPDAAPTS